MLPPLRLSCLSVFAVLDQLLMELHRFLLILDKETLSGNATIQKGLLADLLKSYGASNGMTEKFSPDFSKCSGYMYCRAPIYLKKRCKPIGSLD